MLGMLMNIERRTRYLGRIYEKDDALNSEIEKELVSLDPEERIRKMDEFLKEWGGECTPRPAYSVYCRSDEED